jgi:hypothetical protein
MSALTKEELAELDALESEVATRAAAEATEAKRQHLEALRSSKRLAAKHGAPGKDFVVFETTVGNIAIRRPVDVEVDVIDASSERVDVEKFAAAVTLEPPAAELQALMAKHPGVATLILAKSMDLLKLLRAEEAKK